MPVQLASGTGNATVALDQTGTAGISASFSVTVAGNGPLASFGPTTVTASYGWTASYSTSTQTTYVTQYNYVCYFDPFLGYTCGYQPYQQPVTTTTYTTTTTWWGEVDVTLGGQSVALASGSGSNQQSSTSGYPSPSPQPIALAGQLFVDLRNDGVADAGSSAQNRVVGTWTPATSVTIGIASGSWSWRVSDYPVLPQQWRQAGQATTRSRGGGPRQTRPRPVPAAALSRAAGLTRLIRAATGRATTAGAATGTRGVAEPGQARLSLQPALTVAATLARGAIAPLRLGPQLAIAGSYRRAALAATASRAAGIPARVRAALASAKSAATGRAIRVKLPSPPPPPATTAGRASGQAVARHVRAGVAATVAKPLPLVSVTRQPIAERMVASDAAPTMAQRAPVVVALPAGQPVIVLAANPQPLLAT